MACSLINIYQFIILLSLAFNTYVYFFILLNGFLWKALLMWSNIWKNDVSLMSMDIVSFYHIQNDHVTLQTLYISFFIWVNIKHKINVLEARWSSSNYAFYYQRQHFVTFWLWTFPIIRRITEAKKNHAIQLGACHILKQWMRTLTVICVNDTSISCSNKVYHFEKMKKLW